MRRTPIKSITHGFDYYPPCIVPVISADIGSPNPFTYEDLQVLRKSWYTCIKPLLKHMENPEHVGILLSAFGGNPERLPFKPSQSASDYLWRFIEQVADLFPSLIFPQLEKTIAGTQGIDPRCDIRAKWIRKKVLKDLKKSEFRLRELHVSTIKGILACEKYERDQRLVVLEHILIRVLQEVNGKSIAALLSKLANSEGI